ncbi:MAG: hypothetical protein GY809_02400 [Planctomycetes bacterium]|nr:hypothetical protein [Planctomycetota bacterium]
MNNLRNTLLQQDGLDPKGVTEQELSQFRTLLAQEQKRARRLGWLMMIPMLVFFVAMIGLITSESLLETLNIPFVTASGLVIFGIWIVIIFWIRRFGPRVKQSQDRILSLKRKLPEQVDQKLKGIPLVARHEETKLVFWPGVLLATLLAISLAVIAGNTMWWLLTGSFWHSGIIRQIIIPILVVGFIIRVGLVSPMSSLKALESPDLRFWIAVPRITYAPIPRVFWKTGMVGFVGLMGFIAVMSVYLFFQGNDVYGRAMTAMKEARSIHAIGYGFKEGQRVKRSEIRYEQGRGTHIQWFRGEQVINMYDDGQYRYEHEQGKKYVVKRKSKNPLLPDELTDLPRYLKWTRRDPDRDKHIETVVEGNMHWVMYRCYKREDSNTLSLMWIELASGAPRLRLYEEYRRVEGAWEQVELVEIDYDEPMDLAMPPEVFKQQGIKIVEPETVSQAEYSLDRALATTEVLGLTFAVQDLKRWGDTLLLTCSVRATDQSLKGLKDAGIETSASPRPLVHGAFTPGSWWQRLEDHSIESRPYSIVELGKLHQGNVFTIWYAMLPKADWPGQDEKLDICGYVHTRNALQTLRKAQGLERYGQFRPLLTVDIPQTETSLEQLSAYYHGLAPQIVEVMHSQRLFVSEARDMNANEFQQHLKDLLLGLRPIQETWDKTGPDLTIELVDEKDRPVRGASLGSHLRYSVQGDYEWIDNRGQYVKASISDDQGRVTLPGTRLFGAQAARDSISCLYVVHEQRRLAAVQKITGNSFGTPLRIQLQKACRVHGRLKGSSVERDDKETPKAKVRITGSVAMTRSTHLIVNLLSVTVNNDSFEALLVPGDYELIGTTNTDVRTRFTVPRGQTALDLGTLEEPIQTP